MNPSHHHQGRGPLASTPPGLATRDPRAIRIHDFPTHAALRSCQLSKKSGKILVTGDREKQVHLYTVGAGAKGGGQLPILTLHGHASAVESVCLDWSEEIVVAGAASGTIKLWDLEHAKVIRALLGHKESTRCLEFHPFGEFFASGGASADIKIWDVRRKGCIQTYTGHEGSIAVLRISPDGRWIASGDTQGTIKLWDLTKGKLLAAWSVAHRGQPITDLEFSPSEFLLASLSVDGRVCLFDLQTFEGAGTLEIAALLPGSAHARTLKYRPDGALLYLGCEGACHLVQVEPLRLVESLAVPWPGIADLYVHAEGWALGAALDQNFVGVWRVNVGAAAVPADSGATPSLQEPEAHPSGRAVRPISAVAGGDAAAELVQDHPEPPARPKSMFPVIQPQSTTSLTSLPSLAVEADPMARPPSATTASSRRPSTAAKSGGRSSVESLPRLDGLQLGGGAAPGPGDLASSRSRNGSFELPAIPRNPSLLAVQPPIEASPATTSTAAIAPHARPEGARGGTGPSEAGASVALAVDTAAPAAAPPTPAVPKLYPAINGDAPLNLDFGRFLPRGATSPAGNTAHAISPLTPETERRVLESLSTNHSLLLHVLHARLHALSSIRAVWTPEASILPALHACVRLRDDAVTIDVLRLLLQKPKLITLASCGVLLQLLLEVLGAGYTDYVISACQLVQLLVKAFRALLLDTLSPMRLAPGASTTGVGGGVDLVMEERVQKCRACWVGLQRVRTALHAIPRRDALVKGTLDLLAVLDEVQG